MYYFDIHFNLLQNFKHPNTALIRYLELKLAKRNQRLLSSINVLVQHFQISLLYAHVLYITQLQHIN